MNASFGQAGGNLKPDVSTPNNDRVFSAFHSSAQLIGIFRVAQNKHILKPTNASIPVSSTPRPSKDSV